MLNLNKNTRLFFFQFIFQRNYSTDFELDEFIKQNIKKRPFNKKKLLSLNDSFNIASVTDNNTGIYSPAVTSIYANVFYGWGGNGEHPSATYNQRIPHCVADQQTTSSTQVMISYAANNTAEDCEHVRIGMFGDLA